MLYIYCALSFLLSACALQGAATSSQTDPNKPSGDTYLYLGVDIPEAWKASQQPATIGSSWQFWSPNQQESYKSAIRGCAAIIAKSEGAPLPYWQNSASHTVIAEIGRQIYNCLMLSYNHITKSDRTGKDLAAFARTIGRAITYTNTQARTSCEGVIPVDPITHYLLVVCHGDKLLTARVAYDPAHLVNGAQPLKAGDCLPGLDVGTCTTEEVTPAMIGSSRKLYFDENNPASASITVHFGKF
jgi:hypothetical protein